MSAEDTEEYEENTKEHEEVVEEEPVKKGKKKPLTEKELDQRRTALARTREIKQAKTSSLKVKEKELQVKELELQNEKIKLDRKATEPVPIPVEKKPKKKVQRVIEVSDDSSEEEVEEIYVKKPKAPKKGVLQADYMEMVKQTNAETLRKQLESDRVRLAMQSCFPNLKF